MHLDEILAIRGDVELGFQVKSVSFLGKAQ